MSLSARIWGSLTLVLLLTGTARSQQRCPDWHQTVVDWSNTDADEIYYRYDDSATLSWGEAYVLQTYLWMYKVDADTTWLSKLVNHAFTMFANARDVPADSTADPVYRDGYRGWGTGRYSEHYEEWLVHDGHVCSELARFVKWVYADDELYASFGARADSVLRFLERNVAAKWHSVWDTPRAELPGDIDLNATYSHWIGGENLLTFPVNHFAAFADFALQLWEIRQSARYRPGSGVPSDWYRRVVDDAAAAFRSLVRYDPVIDGYIWPYAKGFGGNDISHAAIELRFAYDCYRAGLHFDETDMRRFAHTLTGLIWANPPDLWESHLYSSFKGRGNTDYEVYTRTWPLLGFFDPLAYAVEAGVFRRFAESGTLPHSSSAAAVATLAYVEKEAPPLVRVLRPELREVEGDGDDLPDPGERLEVRLALANWGPQIDTLTLSLSTSDDRVEVLQPEATHTSLACHDTSAAQDGAFVVRVRPDVSAGGKVWFRVEMRRGGRLRRDSVLVRINPVPLLLVDDDGGAHTERAYQDSVLEAITPYQVWDVSRLGSPGGYLSKYGTVVWSTGPDDTTLSPAERQALATYLDGGGRLILFGPRVEDALLDGPSPDTSFFVNYLHARPSDQARSLPFLTLFVSDQRFYPSPYLTLSASDTTVFRAIQPAEDAQVLVRYGYGPAGIYTTAQHRVAYLTFGLEHVSSFDRATELRKRKRVVEGLLTVLEGSSGVEAPGDPVLPRKLELLAYPTPFRSEVTFRLAGTGRAPTVISIFDARGRLVRRLRAAGAPVLRWDGTDEAARPLPSGVYLVRAQAGERVVSRKVVLVR